MLIATGAAATFLPAVNGLPLAGYGAIALIVIGGILAMPQIARAVLHALRTPAYVPAQLAIAYMRASPGRVAATLAAMVASVSLMVAMAIMVTSFRQSLDDWLTLMLPADVYVRAASDSVPFTRDDRAALARIGGVARAEFMRATSLWLDPSLPRVALLARDIDPGDAAARLALVGDALRVDCRCAAPRVDQRACGRCEGARARCAPDTAACGTRRHVHGGGRLARLRAPAGRGRHRALALRGADRDDAVNEATLWLAPGVDASPLSATLSRVRRCAGACSAATPADLRKLSLAAFDRTFAVTYALEAAAVLIGVVGLSAALVAQTLARSREFGMLRHVGMTRRQIARDARRSKARRSPASGSRRGLVLGFAISLILVNVVNRQSFHWGMALHIPWLALAVLAASLVALATLTARASARTATSIGAVRAVRDDW